MFKRSSSASEPPHTSERLRVVTAGHVGNMDARLGTSGFDVVAVAGDEDELIDAVTVDEPDAIVVEADLCTSLEHVRELAPDAVLIVVGDHTPAGALGRIERGVSGTVMAGLLHALVTEGVGSAVVLGFVPSDRAATAATASQHAHMSMLAHRVNMVRSAIPRSIRANTELATAAGALAVGVTTAVLLVTASPRTHDRAERSLVTDPVVQPQPQPSVSPQTSATNGSASNAGRRRAASATSANTSRPAPDGGLAKIVPPGASPTDAPPGGSPDPKPKPPPDPVASPHPPGVANGWDKRPPKHADNGHRNGWTKTRHPRADPPGPPDEERPIGRPGRQ